MFCCCCLLLFKSNKKKDRKKHNRSENKFCACLCNECVYIVEWVERSLTPKWSVVLYARFLPFVLSVCLCCVYSHYSQSTMWNIFSKCLGILSTVRYTVFTCITQSNSHTPIFTTIFSLFLLLIHIRQMIRVCWNCLLRPTHKKNESYIHFSLLLYTYVSVFDCYAEEFLGSRMYTYLEMRAQSCIHSDSYTYDSTVLSR